MGLEDLTRTMGKVMVRAVDEVKKDVGYVAAAGLYVSARVADGYTTHLIFNNFEIVHESNPYLDMLVAQMGSPTGLIVGMGVTSLVALSLAKILNDGFKWTKHWGTVGLGVMTAMAGYAATNNWYLYLENLP